MLENQPLPYRSVVLTGGSGFVGSYLIPELRARLGPGATLHFLDRIGPNPVNLLDSDAVRALIHKAEPDLVIHMAAQSSVGQAAGAAAETWQVNVGGSINIATAIASLRPNAVVMYVSTSEVYGSAFESGPASEETLPAPLSVYGHTKWAAEKALTDILGGDNKLIIFRPTSHSGAGQDSRFVLPSFAKQIANIEAGLSRPVIKVGSLLAERDFLDVRDVVRAYLSVLALVGSPSRQVFNISSGHPIPIREILLKLIAFTPSSPTVEEDPARIRSNDIPRAEVDSLLLRESYGWAPQISLDDTVADVLNHYRKLAVYTPTP